MREFKCPKCKTTNTLKDWNVYREVFKKITLHDVKDYGILYGDIGSRVLFSCPTCEKGSVADDIEEVLYKDFRDKEEDILGTINNT